VGGGFALAHLGLGAPFLSGAVVAAGAAALLALVVAG